MRLWVVIPVKPFGEGKSRLSERLDTAGRHEISQKLLSQVIHAVHEAAVCAGILVISRDRKVLDFADRLGVETLLEIGSVPGRENLNGALTQAAAEVNRQSADALLVLPADLPFLTAADVRALYLAGAEEGVVIAPARDGGTNALVLHPPGCIHFDFGLDSCANHRRQALEKGLSCKIIRSDTLAFDVDRPPDLDRWFQHAAYTANSSPQACL